MSVAAAIRRAGLRVAVPGAVWPLADQGVVSVGGFVVNLTLARGLPAADYGVFALLLGIMLQIQVVAGSLVFYPLCVRGTVMDEREQAGLFASGLVLALALCLPFGIALAAGLAAADQPGLIVPALLWLVLWQAQELLRRCMFAQLRHAAAIPGDALRYGGQAAALIALAASGSLTLPHAVTAMAVAAGAGVAWQAPAVRISLAAMPPLRQTAAGFGRVGAGSLGSNLLSTLSLQMYAWVLALTGGAAEAAAFQAGVNVIQLVNPVLTGLCNIIPQSVARAVPGPGGAAHGAWRAAWRASAASMALGAAPVCAFYLVAAAWPGPLLVALYGHASPYTALAAPVRIMAAAAAAGFAVEMVNAVLHGLQRTRLAVGINAAGLAAAILVGLPLTLLAGVTGSGAGIAAAAAARAAAAWRVLLRLDGH